MIFIRQQKKKLYFIFDNYGINMEFSTNLFILQIPREVRYETASYCSGDVSDFVGSSS